MTCVSPVWLALNANSSGRCVLLDEPDVALVATQRWYVIGNYAANKHGSMHRFLLGAEGREITVDHVNGNRLDNRRTNLRLATYSENAGNIRSSQNQKRGGFKGVFWDRERDCWKALVKRAGKAYFLGRFTNSEDAARAYDSKARELFGDFAGCNFPEGS